MIVYEVNLSVERLIAEEYAGWLHAHVRELLALEGFVDATILREPEHDQPEREHYVVHYRLESRDALERYLREDAPRMRAEGVERFGGRFTAWRRVLEERDEG